MFWRFLYTGVNDGFYNMALDEAIYENFKDLKAFYPTIRFYTFSPPAITIGYHQNIEDTKYEILRLAQNDRPDCRQASYDIVRRPTGGRAVIHKNDITYSMVFAQDDQFFGGSTIETYKFISELFAKAIRKLGIKTELVKINTNHRLTSHQSPLCFSIPSRYELVVEGEKILGSAQKREDGFILQQGSLIFKGNRNEVVNAIREEMKDNGIEFIEVGLTNKEIKLARSIVAKYKSQK